MKKGIIKRWLSPQHKNTPPAGAGGVFLLFHNKKPDVKAKQFSQVLQAKPKNL